MSNLWLPGEGLIEVEEILLSRPEAVLQPGAAGCSGAEAGPAVSRTGCIVYTCRLQHHLLTRFSHLDSHMTV